MVSLRLAGKENVFCSVSMDVRWCLFICIIDYPIDNVLGLIDPT